MKTMLRFSTSTKLLFKLSFFALFVCLVSCKKDNVIDKPPVKGEAKVKMINASQHSTGVDFYFNNEKINLQTLGFGEASDYIKIASGTKNTSITTNGMEGSYSEVNFVPTFSYTSFYVEDKTGQGDVLTLEDDLSATSAGKARIRFVNLSPYFTNAMNINQSGGILMVNALPFKTASGYFSIDPDVNLIASVVGTGAIKVIPGSEFEPGKIYTIWFSGSSNANLTINKITYN